jgi:(p)ppGpp synthase/HD superfamily hydrolase
MLTNKFARATALALELHATQVRKGTQIPYASHLLGVASLVLEHGGDEEQAIAGLLHDAIEDVGAGVAITIRELFGDRVLRIVEGCTDAIPDALGQKPDWRTHKEDYLAHLERADYDVLLVSASDKLHNARAILTDLRAIGPAVFGLCRTVGRRLRDVNGVRFQRRSRNGRRRSQWRGFGERRAN